MPLRTPGTTWFGVVLECEDASALAHFYQRLLGWQIFGRTWFAEEVGVVATALLAILLGQQWLRFGFRTSQGAQ